MKTLAAVMCAGSMLAGSANAACWTRDEAAAAGVRQLQSMLMVTALRCQAGGTPMLTDYNAFVVANRQAIATENEQLRAHFIHAGGMIEGQRAYDAFTTAMANAYGAGDGAPASCAQAGALAREAATGGSVDALLVLADQLALAPALSEGRCPAPAVAPLETAPVAAPAPGMVMASTMAPPSPAAVPQPAAMSGPAQWAAPVRYGAAFAYAVPASAPVSQPVLAYSAPTMPTYAAIATGR